MTKPRCPGIDRTLTFSYNQMVKSQALQVDLDMLRQFERHLDPRHPEDCVVPVRVLGYGEISTVCQIGDPAPAGSIGLAYKRMPIFRTAGELVAYQRVYDRYADLLQEGGLRLPRHTTASLTNERGQIIFYIVQELLDPATVGSAIIHQLSDQEVVRLLRQVLRALARVWTYNQQQGQVRLGIDGQISNWAVQGLQRSPDGEIDLLYLDTSTPLLRVDGREQLDPELFLRGAPSFLAWLLRRLFLQDVLDRYYDFHRTVVDLIANFYKEQLPELVPHLVDVANDFFASEASALGVDPIALNEVRSYYREDAMIWRFYQFSRRVDRFLHTRVLGKPYPYILPVIERR